jgi:hypothetical protein
VIRVFVAFFVFTLVFWFGIAAFRKITKRQRWRLTKIIGYSILCSMLSLLLLTTIVILF